jgi:hypothetical protein
VKPEGISGGPAVVTAGAEAVTGEPEVVTNGPEVVTNGVKGVTDRLFLPLNGAVLPENEEFGQTFRLFPQKSGNWEFCFAILQAKILAIG